MTLPHRSLFRCLLLAAVAASLIVTSARPSRAQMVLTVNGEAITNLDIEQITRYNTVFGHKRLSRQEAIDQLIDDRVKIKEAKKYSILKEKKEAGTDPNAGLMETIFADEAQNRKMTPEQFTTALEKAGIRRETWMIRSLADFAWGQLIRGRYSEELKVSDKDVQEAMQREGGGSSLQVEGFEYKLQQVVLLVPRGSPDAHWAARRKQAETFRSQVQSCEQANTLFRSTPNATIGEVITKTSSDLPEQAVELRKILDSTPIGHLTPPDIIKSGISMFAVCSRTSSKIDTAKKRTVTNKVMMEKFQRISKRYLAELRRAAMIEKR